MVSRLILVSANGHGAGKSTFASMLGGVKLSLASAIRDELGHEFPDIDWYSQDREYKNTYEVSETGFTVRQLLIARGQDRCNQDPLYWCKALVDSNKWRAAERLNQIAIEDIRKISELEFFRSFAEERGICLDHFHIINPAATEEPQFDAPQLQLEAKYTITLDTRPIAIQSFGGTTNWRQLKGNQNGY